MNGSRQPIRDERGVSLPELLIGILMGTVVIIAALSLVQVVNRSSARTVARIDANQQARPVMERIMDELRSTCLTRGSVPILSGSTGSSISFQHETGSAVKPVPDKRTIDLVGGTLTERAYPASPTTPNSAGVYTFSPTASSTRTMLKNVVPATVDGATVPLFRYFTYVNGVLTPLTSLPLNATDAARTVQVVVSFGASPLQNPTADSQANVTLTGTALLRFGPASEISTSTNAPCT